MMRLQEERKQWRKDHPYVCLVSSLHVFASGSTGELTTVRAIAGLLGTTSEEGGRAGSASVGCGNSWKGGSELGRMI
jgi:hypothetical protein